MDDDDATLPGRAALLRALDDAPDGPPAEVVVGDFSVIGIDGFTGRRCPAPLTFQRLAAPGSQNWGLWATAIRRDTWARFGMHREDLRANEDLDLWLRWLRDGARFLYRKELTHYYLLRPGSEVFTHDTFRIGEEIRARYRAGRGSLSLGMAAGDGSRMEERP
jgi:hypothetical protein